MRLRESLLSRRKFFIGSVLGGLSMLVAYVLNPVVRFLFHREKIPLPGAVKVAMSDVEAIAPNSARYFEYGHLPGILLKTERGELRAFSAKCTHLDCTVQYEPESRKFYCACHKGYFDDKGVNIAGPPPSPLLSFGMERQEDGMIISYQGGRKSKG